MSLQKSSARKRVSRREIIGDVIILTLAGLIASVGVNVFYAPAGIAPGGVAGLSVILNSVIGTPIGLMILILNIPIQILAYRMLGSWHLVAKTIFLVAVYSAAIDLLQPYFPPTGITGDRFLSALFGGILGGTGSGLAYRAGGSFGGTSTLAVILQKKMGTSFNNTYLYTDMGVVALAGLALGWEAALYAMVAIFVDGAVADYILEGPSTIRTATIVTNCPQEVSAAVISGLERGVTGWEGEGMYTGKERHVLFVTVRRPEVKELRRLVFQVDPDAFIVIGHGHTAYGAGFRPGR